MISDTKGRLVDLSIHTCEAAGRTRVEGNDARGATKGEDYTSLLHVSPVSDEQCSTTYQYNVRECKEEERPFEVLPVSRLVFRLIVPQLQLLQERTVFVPREHFASTFRSSGMCRSEALLTIFLVGGFAYIAKDLFVLSDGKLVTLIEQEAREHSLFEASEDKKECAGFNGGCDPSRPAPAASICNGSSSNKSKTVTRLACDDLT